MTKRQTLLLLLIIVLASVLRFTGYNWDAHAHLHPDERFLTMVTNAISWPASILQHFDTHASPLNPHNQGFSFYVYGTYPVHITKLISELLHKNTYDDGVLVGRFLSALSDLATLYVVFLIARHLAKSVNAGLWAALCYALSVLPIQLSHFFTVDPYATLFTAVTLLRVIQGKFGLLTGIAVALAVGAKVSSVLLIPLILLSFLMIWPWSQQPQEKRVRKRVLLKILTMGFGFIITLRLVYPYLFDGWNLNTKVLDNWQQLVSFDGPTTSFPPGIQWIGVSAKQIFLDLWVWGLGIPLGLIAGIAITWQAFQMLKKQRLTPHIIPIAWIFLMLLYQSFQFTKPMRYIYSIYPSIAVMTGLYISHVVHNIFPKRFRLACAALLCITLLLWPLSFFSIYTHPNTRVSASEWIFTNVAPQSTIAWEHWDDPLPFAISGYSPGIYHQIQLPSFDPDDDVKPGKIADTLFRTDYLVLSSNRTYGALRRAETRFPLMNNFYRKLFAGELGFTLAQQFTSRPGLPFSVNAICIHIPGFLYGIASAPLEQCKHAGIHIVDDYADETFTVYDHPKVLIFLNERRLSVHELMRLLHE